MLGTGDARAEPVGLKSLRRARVKMLRTAQIVSGSTILDVRIRDLSPSGMMIEGLPPAYIVCGAAIGLRIGTDKPMRSYIRWEREGRVGIAFATPLPDDHPWLDMAAAEDEPQRHLA